MEIVLTKVGEDGKQYPYSVEEFRRDYPYVTVPKNFLGADLSHLGIFVTQTKNEPEIRTKTPNTNKILRVPMHNFLYALRDFGLRTHFEWYVQQLSSYPRDYWLTAAYVTRDSTFLGLFQEHFQIPEAEIDGLFESAYGYEE